MFVINVSAWWSAFTFWIQKRKVHLTNLCFHVIYIHLDSPVTFQWISPYSKPFFCCIFLLTYVVVGWAVSPRHWETLHEQDLSSGKTMHILPQPSEHQSYKPETKIPFSFQKHCVVKFSFLGYPWQVRLFMPTESSARERNLWVSVSSNFSNLFPPAKSSKLPIEIPAQGRNIGSQGEIIIILYWRKDGNKCMYVFVSVT